MKVLVSGASGLVGTALVPALKQHGHTVLRLVRGTPRADDEVRWSPGGVLDPSALAGVDAIVHLAARNIGLRWTEQSKREIRDSRVQGTRTLAEASATSYRATGTPKVLVSASAIGFYGSRGDEMLTEQSGPGRGFLADVAREWEAATALAAEAGIRTVLPRIGVVLSRRGGALARMLPPFRMGVGGRIGSGHQWMSWIVLEDLVELLYRALTDDTIRGPINAVSPQPVTNAAFTKAMAKTLGRPSIFPLPAFAVRAAFGEMGQETLLSSTRVLPTKLQQLGFKFEYNEIYEALAHAVKS